MAELKNSGGRPASAWAAAIGFAAAVCAVALPLALADHDAWQRIDSEWYLLIAQGRTAQAMQPFTSRQLDPLLSRFVAASLHLTLLHGFFAVGLAAFVFAAAAVGYLLRSQIASGRAALAAMFAVGVLYFWPATMGSFLLPDTLAAALLSLFLLCLYHRRHWMAVLLLLPMFVERESTILVLVCLLGLLALDDTETHERQKRWLLAVAAVASSAAGLAIVRHLAAHAQANREQLNPLLYMAGKVPWNFSANVLSMGPWTPALTNFCAVPRWTLHLPLGLHIGGASTAGLCGWGPAWQMHSPLLALCSFGLLPMATLYLLVRHRSLLWAEGLFTRFCVVYGLLSFLMAPLLGHTVERLFLYAWPVFVLATPAAMARCFQPADAGNARWIALAAIHCGTAWFDYAAYINWDQATWQRAWLSGGVVLALNVAAWQLLRQLDAARAAAA